MQKIIYSLGSTCLNIALQAWTKNEKTYIVNSIFDIKKLADELGCSFVSNKYLEQNIEEFLISFTERLEETYRGRPSASA